MSTPRTLDLGTLRSFITIADTGSMTRAASRLHMTQSAISMQMKRLEQSLEIKVLDRSPQGITPTPPGEQLLSYAKQMLELNDEVWGRLTADEYEGHVSLGVPADIINPHIPTVLREFSRDYPRVQVQLASALTNHLLNQFDKGAHDLVLTTESKPSKGGSILSTQQLIWTGAINGQAWKQRPLPLGFSSGCAFRDNVIKALETSGIEWRDVVVAEDEIAGFATIAADLCIGAELELAEHPNRETIDHGGQLPALANHSIVLYRAANAKKNSPAAILGDYLVRAYA